MNKHKKFNLEDLKQFYGSQFWFKHPLNNEICFTEGIAHMIYHFRAMWLIDEIALAQTSLEKLKNEEFQLWLLDVVGSTAILRCEDGNDNLLVEKLIEFTDFPEPGIKIYCTNNVIMLPGEY